MTELRQTCVTTGTTKLEYMWAKVVCISSVIFARHL